MWKNQKIKLNSTCVGTVVMWSHKNGFGFIRPDPEFGNEDICVYRGCIRDPWITDLYKGQRVYFNIGKCSKGLLAEKVKFEKYFIRPLEENK